jgi:hypothetical protein
VLDTLQDSGIAKSHVAKASRPKHGILKAEQNASGETRGRKREHEDKARTYVHWKNPLLWKQIDDAFKRATHQKKNVDIVRDLQLRNPAQFSALAPQTLGWWIKRPKFGPPRWLPSVLEQVGYSSGGNSTRCGILVSLSLQTQYARLTPSYSLTTPLSLTPL